MDNAAKLDTHPDSLARYAFLWTEARLAISVVALILGTPPAVLLFSFGPLYGFVWMFLKIAWIISGVASAYLLYRWHAAQWYVFDKTTTKDTVALAIAIVSGFNLGLTGLIGQNPGMTIFSGYGFWLLGAALYAFAAYHLYTRYQQSGQKIFY